MHTDLEFHQYKHCGKIYILEKSYVLFPYKINKSPLFWFPSLMQFLFSLDTPKNNAPPQTFKTLFTSKFTVLYSSRKVVNRNSSYTPDALDTDDRRFLFLSTPFILWAIEKGRSIFNSIIAIHQKFTKLNKIWFEKQIQKPRNLYLASFAFKVPKW